MRSRQMDLVVGYILLVGVLLSAAFLLVGILWHWTMTGSPQFSYTLSGTNLFRFWMADIQQTMGGEVKPRLFVNIGIALLLMTPYIRVAASTVYFAFAERNWKYTIFTTFVLSILTYSLFLR